ncbi:hypothetical protein NE237_020483 [Protea cynaroides]|uniref:Uncharacterized protein n=1 Tax=Protea cynaroides TaxID=273540 RepID=A0A9Q0K3X9_9MAGN|nr:hypothetical protein NE237_020483 [Protea cynaroides]
MEMEIDSPKPESHENQIGDEDLFLAAEKGDSSIFNALSQEQLQRTPSLRNDDGRSLLHVAAASGHAEVVKILSAADASISGINNTDDEGWAPLHSAASCGHADVVEILLSSGADVNLKNNGGRTALHYAASKGWLKIAQILISHRAKLNLKDKVGCSALHRAASTGKSELCELLIEEGAEVDSVDKAGQTPLMNAVICDNREVALLLIRHGADVDVEDEEGYTVLGRASDDLRQKLIEAAKAMLEAYPVILSMGYYRILLAVSMGYGKLGAVQKAALMQVYSQVQEMGKSNSIRPSCLISSFLYRPLIEDLESAGPIQHKWILAIIFFAPP